MFTFDMRERMSEIDIALTGKAINYHQQNPDPLHFIFNTDAWYLSDCGYSRIAWNDFEQHVCLTSNSRKEVKAKWETAEVKRLIEALNKDLRRVLDEYE